MDHDSEEALKPSRGHHGSAAITVKELSVTRYTAQQRALPGLRLRHATLEVMSLLSQGGHVGGWQVTHNF